MLSLLNKKLNKEIYIWLTLTSFPSDGQISFQRSLCSLQSWSEGVYKVGIHTGDLSKLKSRYSTYIPNVKVHYFIEGISAKIIEQEFFKDHEKKRIVKKHSKNMSEWVSMPLDEIISELLLAIIGKPVGLKGKKIFTVTSLKSSKTGRTKVISAKLDSSSDDESTSSEDDSVDNQSSTSSE